MLTERQRDIFWSLIQANALCIALMTIVLFRTEPSQLYFPIIVSILASIYQLMKVIGVVVAPISSGFSTPFD